MKFLLAWLVVITFWAINIGARGAKALLFFALGILATLATSLVIGLAVASVDRGDSWDP